MNYQVITDEQKLREFIDWLPDLKPTEKFYLCLFARSKYTKDEAGKNGIPHIKTDKAQLKRFVSDKIRLFDKIRQLEIKQGAYFQKDIPIPQQALALYINPNPRDLWRATFNSVSKLANCLRDNNTLVNPHVEVLSEIQRTKGTTHYVDFDFDVDDDDTLETVIKQVHLRINDEAVTWLKTRGGAHCLINPSKVNLEFKNKWYQSISKLGPDQVGDQMIPVPGTYQGGFTPHFLNTEYGRTATATT